MSNDDIEKENKPKNGCRPALTFQTRDLDHNQIKRNIHRKIMKVNPRKSNVEGWNQKKKS